jgi:hypothetical protein
LFRVDLSDFALFEVCLHASTPQSSKTASKPSHFPLQFSERHKNYGGKTFSVFGVEVQYWMPIAALIVAAGVAFNVWTN